MLPCGPGSVGPALGPYAIGDFQGAAGKEKRRGKSRSVSGKGFMKFSVYCRALAAVRVFSMSMARVMGPTPPGTGVM